ncbi:MAG: hypothetical protein ACFFBT_18240 [Promethearchaeota archaeon]
MIIEKKQFITKKVNEKENIFLTTFLGGGTTGEGGKRKEKEM